MPLPALTSNLRSKLYILLSVWFFITLILAACAVALPYWSISGGNYVGLWSTCVDPAPGATGWTGYTCTEFATATVCDGWFQNARVQGSMAIGFLGLLTCLCIAVAAQTVITTLIPLIIVVITFLTALLTAMTWGSWIVIRGEGCTNTDGADLGSSFVLEVIVFCFCVIALCAAVVLYLAPVLIPIDAPQVATMETKEVPEFAPAYPAAPLYTPEVAVPRTSVASYVM